MPEQRHAANGAFSGCALNAHNRCDEWACPCTHACTRARARPRSQAVALECRCAAGAPPGEGPQGGLEAGGAPPCCSAAGGGGGGAHGRRSSPGVDALGAVGGEMGVGEGNVGVGGRHGFAGIFSTHAATYKAS
eukprot:366521-Chlamydomonas_euryale.AAC.1